MKPYLPFDGIEVHYRNERGTWRVAPLKGVTRVVDKPNQLVLLVPGVRKGASHIPLVAHSGLLATDDLVLEVPLAQVPDPLRPLVERYKDRIFCGLTKFIGGTRRNAIAFEMFDRVSREPVYLRTEEVKHRAITCHPSAIDGQWIVEVSWHDNMVSSASSVMIDSERSLEMLPDDFWDNLEY